MILWEPLVAVLIWGAAYPSIKLGVSEFPPFLFMALGLGLGSLCIQLFSGRFAFNLSKFSKGKLLNAVLAQAAFQVVFVFGLKLTSASTSAILLATSPLMVAFWLYIKEKQKIKWQSLLLGFIGVCLVINTHNAQNSLIGNLLAFASAINWAWYSLAIKSPIQETDEYSATSLIMFIPALFFGLISAFTESFDFWQNISFKGYAGLFYHAFISLPIGMLLWNKGLSKFGANRVIVYTYLEPFIASLLAIFLIGETLNVSQIVGGILTLLAISFA